MDIDVQAAYIDVGMDSNKSGSDRSERDDEVFVLTVSKSL